MCYRLGRLPQPLTKKLFGKSFFELQKLLLKQSGVFGGKFLRIFKVLFTKSTLKQGPLTAVPTYNDNIKSTAMPCFFVCIECWGFRPKPGHKKLFVKSFLELQKLCKNEVVCSGESSLAYLSPKER